MLKSEFPRILIVIIAIFCLLAIIVVLNRGSPKLIAILASVPIAIVLASIFIPVKPIEEYIAMFMTLRAKSDETNYYSTEAVNMLQSFVYLKRLMPDLTYVNYSLIKPFNGIRLRVKSSEYEMKCAAEIIYSRITIADARGHYTEEDYILIKKYFAEGREAIERTAELLNEMIEMGGQNLDLSHIKSYNKLYNESLRTLNNKEKEDNDYEK